MSRIAIIAGQGDHPLKLAETLAGLGQSPFIIMLDGQADADFVGYETDNYPVGQIGGMLGAIKQAGCDKIVMAGKVVRPPLSKLKPDATALKLLGAGFFSGGFSGDDAILEQLKSYLKSENMDVVDSEVYLPRNYLAHDYHFGAVLSGDNTQDIKLAAAALARMSPLDIGQGLVIQAGRILSVEGAEGTDALLARSSVLIDTQATEAIFVKMSKLSQDKTQDAPGFGIQTLRAMAEAGIQIAAFEAEHCRALESLEAIEAEAEKLGITITTASYESSA